MQKRLIFSILVEYGVMEYGEYGLWDVRVIGFITCFFILVIALLSLSLVIKVQLALLVLLILAILDVLIGSAVPSISGKHHPFFRVHTLAAKNVETTVFFDKSRISGAIKR